MPKQNAGPRSFVCPETKAPCVDTRCTKGHCIAQVEQGIREREAEVERQHLAERRALRELLSR
jgi:hypothetical protein